MNTLKYLYHSIMLWINPPKKLAKVKHLSTSIRSRKRWTQQEIDDMVFMHGHGATLEFIAEELDRPIAGVRSKLISLEYITKGKK